MVQGQTEGFEMSWSSQTGGKGPSGAPQDMGDMLDIFRRRPLPRSVLPPSTIKLTDAQAAALPDTGLVKQIIEDETIHRCDFYAVFDNDEDMVEFRLRFM